MPAYRDKKTGLFYVQFYYRDARGAKRHKTKKGFKTELEALLWEKNFKALKDDAMDMTFADFCKVYEAEVRPRVREHTWLTKENIIQSKLTPFFGDMRMCDIRPVDIVRWQNSLAGSTRADGDGFKPTYLICGSGSPQAVCLRSYGCLLSSHPPHRSKPATGCARRGLSAGSARDEKNEKNKPSMHVNQLFLHIRSRLC